jgi:hypothetical protein
VRKIKEVLRLKFSVLAKAARQLVRNPPSCRMADDLLIIGRRTLAVCAFLGQVLG